jgi:hypothetical protein
MNLRIYYILLVLHSMEILYVCSAHAEPSMHLRPSSPPVFYETNRYYYVVQNQDIDTDWDGYEAPDGLFLPISDTKSIWINTEDLASNNLEVLSKVHNLSTNDQYHLLSFLEERNLVTRVHKPNFKNSELV